MFQHLNIRDAQQQALSFLVAQASIIEPQIYRIKYPDIQYPLLIPVDTSGNEWAKSVTFFSMDRFGRADWFHHMARDVPMADITREKFEHAIDMAAVGYFYTLEELAQTMFQPGGSLTTERAAAAFRAYEEFMEGVALRGSDIKNWSGLFNDPNVEITPVAADGTGGSQAWDDKTADQILRDINSVLSGVYVDSLTIEMADTLLLPVAAFLSLATVRIPDATDITVMRFLRENNAYTAQTGQQLTIRAVRGLETAGEGGVGRMIAYRRDPQILKLHLPMPHRFLEVWRTGVMRYDVPGIFRTGGVEIRRPAAVRYVDGIMDAPYE